MYTIYPFLKTGRIYVNSTDESIYIGGSTNVPIKLVTELNIEGYVEEYAGSGGSVVPELPDKASLTLGNTITWASNQWIVSHVTDTEAYLTLKGLSGNSAWTKLQDACTKFANQLTEEQKACLKSIAAGNTSGTVFVATKDQMNGGFSYFNSNSRRALNEVYWTSTEYDSIRAWIVNSDGSFTTYLNKSASLGFRPTICIDLTLYNTGSGGGGSELNPELPDKSSLTVGNTVTFANQQWIVSHKTADTCYLTLKGLAGESTWNKLQLACTSFASKFTEAQKACLKDVIADSTAGKVFVATKDQMEGGFSYFNSDSKRSAGSTYWTSTGYSPDYSWYVYSDGGLNFGFTSHSEWFRPSVALDLTLYD